MSPFFIFLLFLTFSTSAENVSLDLAYLRIADACLQKNDLAQAATHYQHALTENPQNAQAHFGLGKIFYLQGNTNLAIAHFEHSLALVPLQAQAELYLGAAHATAKNIDKAINHYHRAIFFNPQYAKAFTCLGIALYQKKEFHKASQALERAVSLDQHDWQSHEFLALANRELCNFDISVAHHHTAMQLQPGNSALALHTAQTYVRVGKLDEAEQLLSSMLEKERHNNDFLYQLACTCAQNSKHTQAVELFDKILEHNSGHAQARFARGNTLLHAGAYKEGFYDFAWPFLQNTHSLALKSMEHIAGKRILIRPDNDLCEIIHLMRYAQELKKRGAYVLAQVPYEVASLINPASGVDLVVSVTQHMLPAIDYFVTFRALPYFFGTTPETIPCPDTYLEAPAELVQFWREKLPETSAFRIALYLPTPTTWQSPHDGKLLDAATCAPLYAHKNCVF